jgi:hypothetical protein
MAGGRTRCSNGGAERWTQRPIGLWSTARPRSARIAAKARYEREYRRYHRTPNTIKVASNQSGAM